MATYITKTQLARLAMARLRILAPNETIDVEDQTTVELEIDIAKSRLESSVFNGVTLWTNDSYIPLTIVEGFLLSFIPILASHYQSITVPLDMAGEGLKELCRQLTKSYNPDTVNDEPEEPETELLLDASTATGYGSAFEITSPITFQAWITGTGGTIAATVAIFGSNDATVERSPTIAAKSLLFTSSTLTGTGVGVGTAIVTESFICNTQYQYYIAYVSAISGTDATVTVSALGQ